MFKIITYRPQNEAEKEALTPYGRQEITVYRLEFEDSYIEVSNYGAALRKFFSTGLEAVVAYANPYLDLEHGKNYFGSVLTPFAGRYRDASGAVVLHSGPEGGARKFWDLVDAREESMILELCEEGVKYRASYQLAGEGELELELSAEGSYEGPINLGFHPYFNLSKYPDVKLQELRLSLDHAYLPDSQNLPVFAEASPLAHTALDYAHGRRNIASAMTRAAKQPERPLNHSVLDLGGIDHYFFQAERLEAVARGETLPLAKQARLYAPDTGASLEVYSDAPGLVVYSGQFAGEHEAGPGALELTANRLTSSFCGLALEPQLPPNGQVDEALASAYQLRPGECWTRRMRYVLTPGENLYLGPDAANFQIFDDPFEL